MDGSGEPLGFPVPGQEPLELVGLGPARDHPLEHVGQPRTQTNSWLGCSPERGTPAEVVLAGSRLSATIQAFSSSVQRRRRPTPVITSSRRKPSSFVLVIRLSLRMGAGPAPFASGPSSSSSSAGPQGARQTTLTELLRQAEAVPGDRDPLRQAGGPLPRRHPPRRSRRLAQLRTRPSLVLTKLAAQLLREFGLASALQHPIASPSDLTDFVEDAILASLPEPLTIALDEVDRLVTCPSHRDIFAMLRGWHNRRASHAWRGWDRLDLA